MQEYYSQGYYSTNGAFPSMTKLSALSRPARFLIAQKGKTLLTFFPGLDTIDDIKSDDGNKARKDASREPAGLRAGGSMRG